MTKNLEREHRKTVRKKFSLSVSNLLTTTQTLVTLDLSNNKIGGKFCRDMIPGLRRCKSLQTLDLSNNDIRGGLYDIINFLKYNKSLKSLYLVNCELNMSCGMLIGCAIRWISLVTLDLSNNYFDIDEPSSFDEEREVGIDGLKLIIYGLRFNKSIKKYVPEELF